MPRKLCLILISLHKCERLSAMPGLPEFGMAWWHFCSFWKDYPILDNSRTPPGNLGGLGTLSFDYSRIAPLKKKFGQDWALWVLTTLEYPPQSMWRLTAVFSTDTISLSSSQTWISLVSTYVVCERLSVMHELAGVVENLVQNSESAPLFSALAPYPPPHLPTPENWNLGRSWHFKTFQFSVTEYPPPMWYLIPMGNYVWQITTCGDFIPPG